MQNQINNPKYFIRADRELLEQYEKEEGHGIPQFFLDYADKHNEKNYAVLKRNQESNYSSGGFGGGSGFAMLVMKVDEPLIPVLLKYGIEPYKSDHLADTFENIIKKKYPELSISEVYDNYVTDRNISRATFYNYVKNNTNNKERKVDTARNIALALKFSPEEWEEIKQIFSKDIDRIFALCADNKVSDEDREKIFKVFHMS